MKICVSAETIARALKGKPSGAGFTARCPAHEDKTPSLSISDSDGTVLVHCHAGCSQEAVLDQLRVMGLWPEPADGQAGRHSTFAKAYDYTDEAGELLFQCVRAVPKRFWQRRPDGVGGFINNLQGVRVVPYRLPQLLEGISAGRPVFIVEGEKDADNLVNLGLTATCNHGGAEKWRGEHASFLQGADVIILPDNDEAGRRHAEKVTRSLHGIAASVRLLKLPDLHRGGDVSDWLGKGGTVDQLWVLIENAARPVEGGWPTPDPSIATRFQIAAPPFPLEVFGPEWAEWIETAATAKNAPVDYVALSILVGASGTIGARRWVSPWQGWREPAILWGALVGDPSTRKSPSIDAAREGIASAEAKRSENFAAELGEHQTKLATARAAKKAWEKELAQAIKQGRAVPSMPLEAIEPRAPVKPRLYVINATVEKLARIMAEQPGGLLCVCDELAGLIGGFDRYSGGKGGDRAFWLECHGGRPYRLDRVSDGAIDVPHAAAAVLGSIQPDRLQSLVLSGTNDGLACRFIYAWPEPRNKERPARLPRPEAVEWAFLRLAALPCDWEQPPPVLMLTDSAAAFFEAWWSGSHDRETRAENGILAETFGKFDGIALRIALNLELLTWAFRRDAVDRLPRPTTISCETIEAAIRLVDAWCKPMARRVLSEASVPPADKNAATLARWLLKARPERFNARETRRTRKADLPGIRETKEMDEACEALTEAGWIRPAGERQGGSAGRQRSDYEVNPAVYDASFEKTILEAGANSANSANSPARRPIGPNGTNGTTL